MYLLKIVQCQVDDYSLDLVYRAPLIDITLISRNYREKLRKDAEVILFFCPFVPILLTLTFPLNIL